MLMWVDEVAWIAVSEDFPTLHFVTVGMSEVKFKKSVHSKSVLRFDARRKATGRTSVTYHVDVFSRQIESRDEQIVFSTDITFVCVDENGGKRQVNSPSVTMAESGERKRSHSEG